MDFLRIRKKAKERAAAQAADAPAADAPEKGAAGDAPAADAPVKGAAGSAPAADAPAEASSADRGAGAGAPAAADPVVTDADLLEGELAARLQGVPPEADERFATWRPGAGTPPDVPMPPDALPPPREEDFAVVVGPAARRERRPTRREADAGPADPLDEFFFRPDETADHLDLLGAPAAEAAETPESLAPEEYLTFLLGPEEYAVPIGRVKEVLKPPPLTEVPRAPADVLGVVTVRGDVVPVFDPRRRLRLPPAPPSAAGSGGTRIAIVEAGDGPCGLLVDSVRGVVRVRPGAIEPCPQGIASASAECVVGIGRAGERLFMVIDLGALLGRASPGAGEGRADAGP